MKSLFLALALAGVMLSGCATGQAPRPVPAAVAIAQGETTLEAAYNVVAHVYLNRAPSMDPALKAKLKPLLAKAYTATQLAATAEKMGGASAFDDQIKDAADLIAQAKSLLGVK